MTDDDDPAALTSAVEDPAFEEARVHTALAEGSPLRTEWHAAAPRATTSIALDGVTAAQAEALVLACIAAGVPARFTRGRTAGATFEPVDPGDRVFESSFGDHERRMSGNGDLSGPDAVSTVIDLFRAVGWSVRVTDSPRLLDGSDPQLVEDWLEKRIAAAVDERPALQEWAEEYLRTRRAQLADGILRIVVYRQEILAWSP